MAGDYTKFSFKHKNNYSGVYKQQGRVSLDSDWNELSDITDRRWRSETIDIIGKCVVPSYSPDGFSVIPSGVGTFDIGIGRAYVDGIQAECHGLSSLLSPPRYDEVLGEEQGTLPVPYNDQPHLPAPLPQSLTVPVLPPITNRTDLIYLDVWQREVTVIEAPPKKIDLGGTVAEVPGLREIALGGPDTTTRVQTAWQVKAITDVGDVSCPDEIQRWDNETRPSGGRLTTSTHVPPPDDNPCIISAAGGYRGIENRLYRVEIHTPGPLGTAKFKWSRNNASIVASVTAISAAPADQITVESIGRDEILRFNVGDWIEITDDHLEFQSKVGHMGQITDIDEGNRIITINDPVPGLLNLDPTDVTRHTRIKRWDQTSGVDGDGLLTVPLLATDMVDIEDGIRVSFDLDAVIVGGEFKVGDYWVFYARTADGSIEKLEKAPPRGIKHHYCRLALVTWGTTIETTRVHDCRTFWPPAHCCTIAVRPGEDIQAAIDSIPPEGGCICLLPGIHEIDKPLRIDGRKNLTITGTGAASKLVFHPYATIDSAHAMLYIVGDSRDIEIRDVLMHVDTQEHLIFVDEVSKEIKVENCILVNASSTENAVSDCILLGECCKVSVIGSKLVGVKGIVQAGSDMLSNMRKALSSLRPAPEGDDGSGEGDEDEDDVAVEAIRPLVVTLKGLRNIGNDIFFAVTGIELQDVLSGHISENRIQAITNEKRRSYSKPPRQTENDGVAGTVDIPEDNFYEKLEDNISALSICPGPIVEMGDETGVDNEEKIDEIPENTIGTYACLMEDFNIQENQITTTMYGIVLEHCRLVCMKGNNIKAGKRGISVNYGFETKIDNNSIRIMKQEQGLLVDYENDDIFSSYRKRFKTGYLGISIRFVRGLKINRNTITGQSAIGTWSREWGKRKDFQANSLLRLFRIERLWRVAVELGWILYRILSTFLASSSTGENGPAISKSKIEQKMFDWFTRLLSGKYIPHFIGKAEITDNQMMVSRFGVFCYKILTIGGLRICRNRVSGFQKTGILVHHLFSVGLVDTYARVVRCLIKWSLEFLTMLRNALEEFQVGTEPAEPPTTGPGITGIFALAISWILNLCSSYCGHEDTGEGDEEETETPPSPAETLKDALDDFLDNIDPAWIDDLVNQSYRIDKNTVGGSGDGIWTDIDSTHIANNKVTIWPASTVPYETVVFGVLLKQHFDNINAIGQTYFTSDIQGFADSAIELDRDMLFLFSIGALNWMEDNGDNEDFQTKFLSFLNVLRPHIDPTSNLITPITDIQEALNADPSNTSDAIKGWKKLIYVIMNELAGYGIVMRGANMVCRENIVTSKTNCILSLFSVSSNLDDSRQSTLEIPAIGGIWQYSNSISWFVDFIIQTREINLYDTIMSLLALLALLSEKNRNICIAQNEVDRGLVHGIRTLGVMGSRELEIFDNVVKNASRYSICHRELFNDEIHGKIHRNTLTKSEDSSVFAKTNIVLDDEFFALIWIENDDGTILISQNHGDDNASFGQSNRAVFVDSYVVGIIANHIMTVAEFAFEVKANNGLFTDNMTDKQNNISSTSSIEQGPNIDNL